MGNFDRIRDLYAERRTFFARVFVAILGCTALSLLLIWRAFDLQVLQHEQLSTRSNDNRMRLVTVPPVRGLIFDRNGVVLAQNSPAYVLELVPEQVRDIDATLDRLGEIVSISQADIDRFRERLARTPRYRGVPIRTRLSFEEVARFQVNRHEFPGVDVRAGLTREYPLGASMAHLVGYVGGVTERDLQTFNAADYRGTTHIGKTGVEREYEELLHGSTGAKIVETNATGRPLRDLEYRPGEPGANLHLTVDARLQKVAEAALEGLEGAIVAMDPRNGEVLALVSRPAFEPRYFVDGISHERYNALNSDPRRPLFNRALAGTYPPGSTIKPMMGLIGLEEHVVGAHQRVYCPGHYELPNVTRRFRDWKRQGHGWVDLERAIAESCDVYYYHLAHELGIDRIERMLGWFGLGQDTGIDLPGERAGIAPSRAWKRAARGEVWFPGETLNIGIGQGYMTMTPLQIAAMTARVATRGGGMRPHVLKAVERVAEGRTVAQPQEALPEVPVADEGHWQAVEDGMVATMHSVGGTAHRSGRDAAYTIAGKTGTSQVAGLAQEEAAPDAEDVPKRLRDHALFTAYAPADDPRIVIAVLVEHGGSGSSAAAPIGREVLDAWLIDQAAVVAPELPPQETTP
ncbi:penicillin-binding protein 2 [Algiphilus sp.]|uniref:penicillin-binding protein 2 n=1 Tax=Algiphilus sp. TaxID=1872431 RepID=UPI0025BAC08F|nr:penicillin-binding protein 2 [Algiphilus sp.]MCK5769271.1 penicillin-binding protein 2 [Algiphilus sp.]